MVEPGSSVVVTGLGVVAPNGVGVRAFDEGLRAGRSGVRANREMSEHGFACRVAGVPPDVDVLAGERLGVLERRHFDAIVA
jgi:3-oxoacyl-(acyl-carrier-protein) synthase